MNKRTSGVLAGTVVVTLTLFLAVNVPMGQAHHWQQGDPTPDLGRIASVGNSQTKASLPDLRPTPTPVPQVNSYDSPAQFSFRQLGQGTIALRYLSAHEIWFRLPARWSLTHTSSIDLHYDAYLPTGLVQGATGELIVGAPSATVYVNDILAGSFVPVSGYDRWITLPFPLAAALPADNPGSAYTIRIEYVTNNDLFCDYDGVLNILDDSAVRVSFELTRPLLDLVDFPLPLVQNSFLPETLQIVVPDNPSENDLAAAATVAAAIGGTSESNVKFNLIKASQASLETLQQSDAVIIGQPNKNQLLKNLYKLDVLPTSLDGTDIVAGQQMQSINPQDGVLQLMPSTVDPYYTFLIVTGDSPEGVKRAASSLASPSVGQEGTLAIIKADTPAPEPTSFDSGVFTFLDLGFDSRTFYGLGQDVVVYLRFFVPRDWQIEEGAALVLYYAHSANLNPENSSITVYLNGNPIASALIDVGRQGEKRAMIPLSKQDIQAGTANFLRIETVTSSELVCTYEARSYWVNIRDSSFIRLPHTLINEPALFAPLTSPVYYLAYEPETLISLPAAPTQDELNGMANFAHLLGSVGHPFKDFSVSMDAQMDLSTLTTPNILMIGKPSTNPHIQKINDALPQPFVEGEDTLKQQTGPVIYRTPQDVSIGLVQALPAPWNPENGITLITGTTDEGLKWALDKVSDPAYTTDFLGDICFVGSGAVKAYSSSTLVARVALDRVGTDLSGTPTVLEELTVTPESMSSGGSTPTVSPDLSGTPTVLEEVTVTPESMSSGGPTPTVSPDLSGTPTVLEKVTVAPEAMSSGGPTPTVSPNRYAKPQPSPSEEMSKYISLYLMYGLVILAVVLVVVAVVRTTRGGRRS